MGILMDGTAHCLIPHTGAVVTNLVVVQHFRQVRECHAEPPG